MKQKKIFLLYIILKTNNIFFLLFNSYPSNNIINWTSCGRYKNKGLKKITINSIKISLNFIMLIYNNNLYNKDLHIKIKGVNKLKKIILKLLKQFDLNIITLSEEISVIHGGCKSKKRRKL
uniref:ribosomal protein S11 n=1 Tax=Heterosiphonia pulchra TaxID=189631 RepID=UPI002E796F32|nr:ribosomal protein S11 [Heterosiphonia pulchra]WQF69562.1 ribosomal protein S11 [Heterosiphonia pulchra]